MWLHSAYMYHLCFVHRRKWNFAESFVEFIWENPSPGFLHDSLMTSLVDLIPLVPVALSLVTVIVPISCVGGSETDIQLCPKSTVCSYRHLHIEISLSWTRLSPTSISITSPRQTFFQFFIKTAILPNPRLSVFQEFSHSMYWSSSIKRNRYRFPPHWIENSTSRCLECPWWTFLRLGVVVLLRSSRSSHCLACSEKVMSCLIHNVMVEIFRAFREQCALSDHSHLFCVEIECQICARVHFSPFKSLLVNIVGLSTDTISPK